MTEKNKGKSFLIICNGAWLTRLRGDYMHMILFDNYRKFQKEKTDNPSRDFVKFPIVAKILLAGIVLCLVGIILFVFFDTFKIGLAICLFIQGGLCICLYFYSEKFQIHNSSKRFSAFVSHCHDIKIWLSQTGITMSEENITEIIKRLTSEIELAEKQRITRRDCIEKWVQILIIPIFLAIFSSIIKEQSDLTKLLTYALTLLTAFGIVALTLLSCYNAFDFFRKHKIEQLKSFVNDLQGVLDCEFANKLFNNCDNKKDKQ